MKKSKQKGLIKTLMINLALAVIFALAFGGVFMLASAGRKNGMVGTSVSAAVLGSGSCGSNLTWSLDDDGTLTITGYGAMTDYYGSSPWRPNSDKITSIVFNGTNGGITKITAYAFNGCANLTSITIPASVTSVETNPFYGCGLESIEVENGNTYYRSEGNCLIRGNALVAGCKNSVIPASVTTIDGYAFKGCAGLTSIEIPSGVWRIGGDAFVNCKNLTSITIPASVTSIAPNGGAVLGGCTRLESITVDADNANYKSEGNCLLSKNGSSLIEGCKNSVIPDEVTSLGNYAFYGCDGLVRMEIPSSVTNIGTFAFCLCTNLKYVVVNGANVSLEHVYAFDRCEALEAIYVPDARVSYYQSATNWKDYKSKIKGISEMPLETTVDGVNYEVINNQATIVGYENGIDSDLIVPENVTVDNVEYPVVAIANGALNGANLESVTFTSETPITMGENVFGANSGVAIYVPTEYVGTYQSAWSAYSGQIEELPETGVALNLSILLVTLVSGGALIAVAFKRKEQL